MTKMLVDILGAKEGASGSLKTLKLPGLFIMMFKGTPSGPANGSSVNHMGFITNNYAEFEAKVLGAGIKPVINANKQMIFDVLDGFRAEVFEDPAAKSLVQFHHMHLSVPDPEATRAWYVKTFGAEVGSRRNLPSAMFPGGEVDFLKAAAPRDAPAGTVATVAATKGRSIDHIGFEVKDLKAFTDKLKADGVPFDMEMRDMMQQIKLKIAFILDPVGTRIELTEGLVGQ